jgi:hypothetical protein
MSALPVPPHQNDSWNAPPSSGIPQFVIDAVPSLFYAGWADPRGCEYRHVEILKWGREPVETHGWVFGKYMVAWNGMVYPEAKSGKTCRSAKGRRGDRRSGRMQLGSAGPPIQTVETKFWTDMNFDSNSITPISLTLLLRLGRADLTFKLWGVPPAPIRTSDAPAIEHGRADSWSSSLVGTWLSSAFR